MRRRFGVPWLALICTLLMVLLYAPLVIAVRYAFNGESSLTWPPVGWSMQWFVKIVSDDLVAQFGLALDNMLVAIKAAGGKMPSREQVSVAVRKTKHTGLTGAVEFDEKGDPKKALYFVLQVMSDDPGKWGENKEVKRLSIAAPALKKS